MKAGAAHLKRRVRKLGGYRKLGPAAWVFFDDEEGGVTTWEGQAFPSLDAAKAALDIPEDGQVLVVSFVSPKKEGGAWEQNT